jgi:hypothetical protein
MRATNAVLACTCKIYLARRPMAHPPIAVTAEQSQWLCTSTDTYRTVRRGCFLLDLSPSCSTADEKPQITAGGSQDEVTCRNAARLGWSLRQSDLSSRFGTLRVLESFMQDFFGRARPLVQPHAMRREGAVSHVIMFMSARLRHALSHIDVVMYESGDYHQLA